MEQFDLYTKDRKNTGLVLERGKEIPDGYYHLVISVWIRNKHGKYLLSKRAANKQNYPNMWECTCGNMITGENTISGAIREVREELGIELPLTQDHLVFTQILEEQHYIYDVFLIEFNGHVTLKKATCDEVADTMWATKAQIENLYLKGKFRDDLMYFFDTIEPGKNFTYIVRCNDNSYYTGWTNNLEQRIEAHNKGNGAKYTKFRRPVNLVYYEEFNTKIEAMQREYAIKQLTRKEKEALINSHQE